MPGTWFGRIGHRLLHRDTFAMMLAPAIADLQFELAARDERRRGRPRDYWAVTRALAGALWFDTGRDLRALRADVDLIALLTLLQTSYYTFMLVLLSGLGTWRISTLHLDASLVARATSYVAGVTAACLLTSSMCFWPPRRASEPGAEE